MHIEFSLGGYIPTVTTHAQRLSKIQEYREEEAALAATKQPPKQTEIKTDIQFGDDLSVSWTLPESYVFLETLKYGATIDFLAEDGERVGAIGSANTYTKVKAKDLIQYIAKAFPKKLTTIRCTYSPPYNYEGAPDKYYIDIDLSAIRTVASDEQVQPGTYTHYPMQWVAQKISLAEGQQFEAGAYYVLIGRETTSRNPKYNSSTRDAFIVQENTDSFVPPTDRSYGVSITDEIRIQKVTISGNAEAGFTLYISPISQQIFTVEARSAYNTL